MERGCHRQMVGKDEDGGNGDDDDGGDDNDGGRG
jgi:hypothetical protein